ncbi:IPT/TIG domain-containing protein [Rufibacter sp. XAAS-G3-1]|uniref:IPT/TIG domain-containing protein n=1 Tax=Rufibacter sp. XAAS-G3-1 TaxID=2729134 RepID=UPI0015E7E4BC|nr:IPT/TIG domain-containing protein [Rufibacter sp. XAAS-G3-1]
MKNLYKVRLLLVAFLMVSIGFLSSCDDDDDAMNSGQVELLSFGPTGAKHGDKIKFIGRNLDQVESIQLRGALVAKAQFTSQSSDLIELVVPTAAEEGKVTLKLANGTEIASKTDLSFEVPVTVTGITASAKPGTNITITGNYLNWVDSLQFGALPTRVTTFVSKSMTELVVTVPMEAKSGSLILYTGGTEPLVVETEQEVAITLPAVTGLAPAALKHGDNLTITGTNLDLVSRVKFTGVGEAVVSAFVSRSEAQLVVKVPDNASSGKITLVALSMEEVPSTQTIAIILPAITGFNPTPVEPGANLTINGTNLDMVKSISFTGGASVATFVSQSPTQLVVKVPSDALKGVLTFVTTKDYTVKTDMVLDVKIDRPAYFIYNDALNADWQLWGGWGKSLEDMGNAEHVSRGAKAIKLSYNDVYGAMQLHPNKANVLAGYTKIKFYIYGGTGATTRYSVSAKNLAGVTGDDYAFDVRSGEYTVIEVPISALGDLSGGLAELYFKNYGTNPNTVFIDDIELI